MTTKIKHCDIHGEYESIGLDLMGRTIFPNCPECGKERESEENEARRKEKKRRELNIIRGCGISERNLLKTFDDVECPNDEIAKNKAACIDYAKKVDDGFSGSLLMIGKVGTGKTLLASCIIKAVSFSYDCRIFKFAEITRNIRATYQRDSEFTDRDIINDLSSRRLLIIDEMGVQSGSDAEKQVIFEIIDNRYQKMLPTVVISNLDIQGLTDVMGERVIDRLREGGGKLLAFNSESMRAK